MLSKDPLLQQPHAPSLTCGSSRRLCGSRPSDLGYPLGELVSLAASWTGARSPHTHAAAQSVAPYDWQVGQMCVLVLPVFIFCTGVPHAGQGFPSR